MASVGTRALFDSRLLLLSGVVAFLFVTWTALSWSGVAAGGRHSVWKDQPFGEWPVNFGSPDGANDVSFSIHATLQAAPSNPALSSQEETVLGETTIGQSVDSANSNFITGSKFSTGASASVISSMSVYVLRPVDTDPKNKFQVAVYSDRRGKPGQLIAKSGIGILTRDAWNTLPIVAELRSKTTYWLTYNSNGSNQTVNNMAFEHANSLTGQLRHHQNALLRKFCHFFEVIGNFAPMSALMLSIGIVAFRNQQRDLAGVLAAYTLAMIIVLVLKEVPLLPYGEYPSGHVTRMAFTMLLLACILPGGAPYIAALAIVAVEGFAVIYMGGHYPNEVIGGFLLGTAMAVATHAFVSRGRRAPPSAMLEQKDP